MVVLVLMMLYFGVLPRLAAVWLLPLTALAVDRRAGGRDLALGTERPVPRRPVRRAVPDPALALRLPGRLLVGPRSRAQWRAIYQLNPMAGVLEGFRWALLGEGTPPRSKRSSRRPSRRSSSWCSGSPTSVASSAPSRTSSDMGDVAISVEGLGKRYQIGAPAGSVRAPHGVAVGSPPRADRPRAASAAPERRTGSGRSATSRSRSAGRGRGRHRSQRSRQDDAPEGPLAHHGADRGQRRRCRAGSARCSRSAPASTRS